MPLLETIKREQNVDQLRTALFEQFRIAQMTGKKLIEEHREETALALLGAGLNLIPSDHLQDHQFVVSRGVYDAAKRMCERDK